MKFKCNIPAWDYKNPAQKHRNKRKKYKQNYNADEENLKKKRERKQNLVMGELL